VLEVAVGAAEARGVLPSAPPYSCRGGRRRLSSRRGGSRTPLRPIWPPPRPLGDRPKTIYRRGAWIWSLATDFVGGCKCRESSRGMRVSDLIALSEQNIIPSRAARKRKRAYMICSGPQNGANPQTGPKRVCRASLRGLLKMLLEDAGTRNVVQFFFPYCSTYAYAEAVKLSYSTI
jgi:hypothetical protein